MANCNSSKQPVENHKITFYPSGKMESKVSLDQSKKRQGLYEEYFEGGQIKMHLTYYQDTLEGPFQTFAQDGKLESKGYFWHGKQIGPTYYYEDGMLKLYNEYDYNQKRYYIIKYDTGQKVIKEEGVAISPVLLVNGREIDSLPSNSTSEINFFYAEPQGYKNSLHCMLNGNSVEFKQRQTHVGSILIGGAEHGVYHLKITSTLFNGKTLEASDSIVSTLNLF
jgi:hypothetical protein